MLRVCVSAVEEQQKQNQFLKTLSFGGEECTVYCTHFFQVFIIFRDLDFGETKYVSHTNYYGGPEHRV